MRFLLVGLVACKGDCPQWYADEDGDGFGQGEPLEACDPKDAPGRVQDASDCDDERADVHPDAAEVCDPSDADEDCDGLSDDEDTSRTGGTDTWADADGDGFGDPGSEVLSFCVVPAGRVEDTGDCDDDQARTFPGAAWQDSDTECLADLDGDGYGAAPGTDCDDSLSDAYPGAPELFGDGIDQDCDTFDPWELHDDFESGAPDPGVWAGFAQPPLVEELGDSLMLRMEGDGAVQTVNVDTTACENLWWSYSGMSLYFGDGPQLQYFDGFEWVSLDQWASYGFDYELMSRSGHLGAPAAYHPALSLRLVLSDDYFYLDEFRLACTGPDADGDLVGERDDCDESSPAHWYDCGECFDLDVDGYGAGCDLGPDCDDSDAAVFPTNPDLATDGLDDDCNGLDGPGIFEDFEEGAQDPFAWQSMTAVSFIDHAVHDGQWAIVFSESSEAISLPFDATLCDHLQWSYWIQRGSSIPQATDAFVLSWDDGTDWVPLDTLSGNGSADGALLHRQGVLSDPAALWSGFRVKLHTEAEGAYYVDDLLVTCSGPDADGDTFPTELDCDDTSAMHWSDCSACQDADGDGYGLDCDQGNDCDDTSADRHPQAPDPYGDGLDDDCDGSDGTALSDDFELGYASPAVWDTLSETSCESAYPFSGAFSFEFDQEDRAVTQPIDTTACPLVVWRFQGRRVTPPPDPDEYLQLSWFDGASWVSEWRWYGTGDRDDEFTEYLGLIDDPAAFHPDFRVGFETNDIATSKFLVDDLVVACSEPDLDLDGYPGALDCDNADAAHWSDCAVCEDPDGDDHGPGCDLGDDCAPSDAAIFPGALDPLDGTDTDCSGIDGPGFVEDFEAVTLDPARWSESVGDIDLDLSSSRYLSLTNDTSLTSIPLDLSVCSSWSWSYEAHASFVQHAGDRLLLEWWDGSAWVEADRMEPTSGYYYGSGFELREGTVTDAAALASGFRFRFRTDIDTFGVYRLDNVVASCTPL